MFFVIADFTADSPRCLVLYHDSVLVRPSSVLLFLNIFLKAVQLRIDLVRGGHRMVVPLSRGSIAIRSGRSPDGN